MRKSAEGSRSELYPLLDFVIQVTQDLKRYSRGSKHKRLALEKIRVEGGCVDPSPLSWPQVVVSDGT